MSLLSLSLYLSLSLSLPLSDTHSLYLSHTLYPSLPTFLLYSHFTASLPFFLPTTL